MLLQEPRSFSQLWQVSEDREKFTRLPETSAQNGGPFTPTVFYRPKPVTDQCTHTQVRGS